MRSEIVSQMFLKRPGESGVCGGQACGREAHRFSPAYRARENKWWQK